MLDVENNINVIVTFNAYCYKKMSLYGRTNVLYYMRKLALSSLIKKHVLGCSLCSHAPDAALPSIQSEVNCESEKTENDDSRDGGGEVQADEKQAEMLTLLNSLPESELKMLKFVNTRIAAGILAHRENHGAFGKLEDLLKVPGVGWKTLEKLGVDTPSRKPERTRIDAQSNLAADLTTERLSALNDVVSVDVGLKHIAWVHMDRERWVHRWSCRQIEGISPGKWEPLNYLRVVTNVIEEMPRPDLYILEHKSFTSLNKGTFQTMLFVRCLESMFFTSLNPNFVDSGEVKAISLSQNTVGRHFDLLVGTQRKSGQALARALLNEGLEKRNAWFPARICYENAAYFDDSNRYVREHLANSLLRAVAFYDIYVNRKPGFKMK